MLTQPVSLSQIARVVTTEFDELGWEAPAPVGHPGRAGLPEGHPTGPEIGERLPDFELRNAPMIEIPDAYHHVMLDQPIAMITAVRALLADWEHSVPRAAQKRDER